jgi:hypothetical protein
LGEAANPDAIAGGNSEPSGFLATLLLHGGAVVTKPECASDRMSEGVGGVTPSQFAGTNQATAVTIRVDDVEASVAELKASGAVLESYDFDEGFAAGLGSQSPPRASTWPG